MKFIRAIKTFFKANAMLSLGAKDKDIEELWMKDYYGMSDEEVSIILSGKEISGMSECGTSVVVIDAKGRVRE